MQSDAEGAVLRTLLFTDLVDSTALIEQLGDKKAAELFRRVDRASRDLLTEHGGLEIDKTDGFLHLFETPLPAIRYALALHERLESMSDELEVTIRVRAAVHMGEVHLHHNTEADVSRGAKPIEVEGLAKPTGARFLSLAGAGQTLVSRMAFDLAKRAAVGEDLLRLRWLVHGKYAFKGVSEPMEVCEVGIPGTSPLRAPVGGEKARPWEPKSRGPRTIAAALVAAVALLSVVGLYGYSQRTVEAIYPRDSLIRTWGGFEVRGEPVEALILGRPAVRVVRQGGKVRELHRLSHTGDPALWFHDIDFTGPQYDSPWRTLPPEQLERLTSTANTDFVTSVLQNYDDDGLLESVDYADADGEIWFRDVLTRDDDAIWHHIVDSDGIPLMNWELHDFQHSWMNFRETVDDRGWRVSLAEADDQGREAGNHRHTFDRDAVGNVVALHSVDAAGNAIQERPGVVVRRTTYGDAGYPYSPTERAEYTVGDLLLGQRQACGIQTWTLDARGRRATASCLDAERKPQPALDGCADQHYAYGDTRTTRCMSDQEPAASFVGNWVFAVESFDERGHLAEVRYLDANQAPAVNGSGVAVTRWTWDAEARLAKIGPFDGADGKLAPVGPSSWGRILKRNAKGQVETETNLGPDGQPAPNALGATVMQFLRSDVGRIGIRALTANSSPAVLEGGYSGIDFSHDDLGRMDGMTWVDGLGKPVAVYDGRSEVRWVRNAKGQTEELSCWDVEGAPMLCSFDSNNLENENILCHRLDIRWGPASRPIRRSCLGVDNKPRTTRYGWAHAETASSTLGGSAPEIRFLDASGQLVNTHIGAARSTVSHDATGRPLSTRWFDADGQPAIHSQSGCIDYRASYDDDERTVSTTCEGANEVRVPARHTGCAELRQHFDARDQVVSESCFDPDGNPTLNLHGFHRVELKYDPSGRLVRQRMLGPEGQPINTVAGTAEIRNQFDAFGKVAEQEIFRADGQLRSRLSREWDNRGNLLSEWMFQPQSTGRPNTARRFKYDGRGRTVSVTHSDAEGNPTTHEEDAHRHTFTYGGEGERTKSTIWHDVHGRPTTVEGCHEEQLPHDERGNLTARICLDADGELTTSSGLGGAARIEMTYDARNRRIRKRSFDTQGEPMNTPGGFHRMDFRYNEVGDLAELAIFDREDQRTTLKRGLTIDRKTDLWPGDWHRHVHEFDDAWREVAEWFEGPDGQPVDGPWGWASRTVVYDLYGNPADERWFDATGEPTPGKDGCTRRLRSHASDGAVLNETCET